MYNTFLPQALSIRCLAEITLIWWRNDNVSSSPSIVNTVFSGNVATTMVAESLIRSFPSIVNSTFSGNSATRGGGIDNTSSSSPTIYNSVFYGNGSDIENSSSPEQQGEQFF